MSVVGMAAAAAQTQSDDDLTDRAARLADQAERRLGTANSHAEDIESLKNTVDQVLALLEGAREVNDGLKSEITILSRNLTESGIEGDKARDLNAELEKKIAELTAALTAARTQGAGTETALQEERRRLEALQRTLAEREQALAAQEQRIAAMTAEMARQKTQTGGQEKAIQALEKQLADLQALRDRLQAERDAARRQVAEQKQKIDGLDDELRQMKASEVQELARYRSEFFGRLRRVLGGRRDIRVEGDRFVFQAEVLFGSGSADLGEKGQQQLAVFARTLREIAVNFPRDLAWVVRVDGHTDDEPIRTPRFPSNWELSAARALSVVHFLESEGIPPNRLVAAGFGEHHPADAGNDEIAKRRNRRIEIKLTQR